MMELLLICPFCGKEHSVVVPVEGFSAWQYGEKIQDALPELSPTEREQILSQICPSCQETIFS